MAERSVVVRIRAEIGDFKRQMAEVAKVTKETGDATQRTGRMAETSLGRMVQSAHKNRDAWDATGKSMLAFGAAVSVGVGLAIKTYAEFDKQMSKVRAATKASASEMGQLREAAINAGADTAFSAKEAAQGIEELAKAGVATKDILGGGLAGALSLAAAGEMEVKDAAELTATAMSVFGKEVHDKGTLAAKTADLLAAGAGKAQGSVHDMGMALKQSALVAESMGFSLEETTAGLAAFANAGLLGSDAGTSFKTMLAALTPNSEAAAKMMDQLGIDVFNADGSMKSLSEVAGILQSSMSSLTPEARAAAMEIIFGSDAVRAANVLYDEGAAGIDNWTKKVSEAGYAAITASIQQDNLIGDLEKLGGSLDSVFLQSGSGANDFLRGAVQSAEDFVDAIGDIPGPVLSTIASVAGMTAGAALLGGAFLTVVPRVLEGVAAFKQLDTRADGTSRGLGKIAKAATIAGAALIGLQAAGQLANAINGTGRSFEEMANKILEANQAGEKFGETFNADFLKDTGAKNLTELFDVSDEDSVIGFLNNTAKAVGGFDSSMHRATDTIGKADEVIAGMVKNGNSQAAADTFKKFAKASDEAGLSTEKLFERFPEYRDSLLEQARVLGTSVTQAELYDWAMGNVPPKIEAATRAQESNTVAAEAAAKGQAAAAEALAEVGVNADGTIASLEKYTTALFNAGLIEMDARTATAAHEAALDATRGAVEEATAALAKQYELEGMSAEAAQAHAEAQMGVGIALKKNKSDFDLSNAAGRALNDSFQNVAATGMAAIEAKAKAGMGQKELQANLSTTFSNLRQTAIDMGLTEAAADALAREVMGIPPKANIDTWMSDNAKRMAEETARSIEALDGKTARTHVIHTTTNVVENIVNNSVGGKNNTGGRQGTKPTFQATGGEVVGPGTGTSDDVPAWLSNGEHVLTAAEVQKAGGQAAIYRMRQAIMEGNIPKFARGGAVQAFATGGAVERREAWLDYERERRRGNGYQVARTDPYSMSDRLTSLADSGNVSAKSISRLYTAAGRGEVALRGLHARSDRLSTSLEKAKDRLEDLQSTRREVASGLSGEFKLSDAVKSATFYSRGSMGGIQKFANETLARIRKFAGLLNTLQKRGYSAAIIQEVAEMGTEEGIKAAEILANATTAERNQLNSTYVAIDKASDAAGIYVTNAMYKGGVNAAAGLVKGLQSQEKAIEKQMLKIGLDMERALKQALGIRSPSRKAIAIAQNFTGTLTDNLKEGRKGIAAEARALGDALTVPSKSMAGGYGTAMASPGLGMSASAAGSVTHVTHNWNITESGSAVTTAHEVARRQQSLEV